MAVVIPANNEEARIDRLLLSLLDQADVRLGIVVVCNGCTDASFARAASHATEFADRGHDLKVVEMVEASKSAALNLGDDQVGVFPRAYMDADIVLEAGTLNALCRALQGEAACLAGPQIRFERPADWFSALVASATEALPPFSADVGGGGLYAVNQAARARWDRFPDVIADDTFVAGRFERSERRRVENARIFARFPDARRLLGVFMRWEAGRRQLRSLGYPLPRTERRATLLTLLRRPDLWLAGACWLAAKAAAKLLALRPNAGPWKRAEA